MKRAGILSLLFISIVFSQNYFPLQKGYSWTYEASGGVETIVDSILFDTVYNSKKLFFYSQKDTSKYSPTRVDYGCFFQRNDTIFHEGLFNEIRFTSSLFSSINSDPGKYFYAKTAYSGNENIIDHWYYDSIYFAGNQMVPAGQFESCYTVQSVDGNMYTYAPNVGCIIYSKYFKLSKCSFYPSSNQNQHARNSGGFQIRKYSPELFTINGINKNFPGNCIYYKLDGRHISHPNLKSSSIFVGTKTVNSHDE